MLQSCWARDKSRSRRRLVKCLSSNCFELLPSAQRTLVCGPIQTVCGLQLVGQRRLMPQRLIYQNRLTGFTSASSSVAFTAHLSAASNVLRFTRTPATSPAGATAITLAPATTIAVLPPKFQPDGLDLCSCYGLAQQSK